MNRIFYLAVTALQMLSISSQMIEIEISGGFGGGDPFDAIREIERNLLSGMLKLILDGFGNEDPTALAKQGKQNQRRGAVQREVITTNVGGIQTVQVTEVHSGGGGPGMINMMPTITPIPGGIIISRGNLKKGNGVAKVNPIRIFSGNSYSNL
jgi:hypothetical protein